MNMILILRSEYELVIDLYHLFTALLCARMRVCVCVCECESVCVRSDENLKESGKLAIKRERQRNKDEKTSILNSKFLRRLQSTTCSAYGMLV